MSLKSWQRAQAPVRIFWWLKWGYQVRNSGQISTVWVGVEEINFTAISDENRLWSNSDREKWDGLALPDQSTCCGWLLSSVAVPPATSVGVLLISFQLVNEESQPTLLNRMLPSSFVALFVFWLLFFSFLYQEKPFCPFPGRRPYKNHALATGLVKQSICNMINSLQQTLHLLLVKHRKWLLRCGWCNSMFL